MPRSGGTEAAGLAPQKSLVRGDTMNRLQAFWSATNDDHLTPEQEQMLRLVRQWREAAEDWRALALENGRLVRISFAMNVAVALIGVLLVWKFGM